MRVEAEIIGIPAKQIVGNLRDDPSRRLGGCRGPKLLSQGEEGGAAALCLSSCGYIMDADHEPADARHVAQIDTNERELSPTNLTIAVLP